MTIRFSTGLRNGMLNATGLKEAFANGTLKLFSGPQPASADAAEQGTLLCQITLACGAFTPGVGTNGINFDAPVSAVIDKAAAETWSGTAVAAGTLGWFRFQGNAADAGGSSTTLSRIDGTIGTSGADLNLANITMEVGTPVSISEAQFTFPAA